MSSELYSKIKLINELSKIDSVIFVGGTSEYLQGIKPILNDIDISIIDPNELTKFGYIFRDKHDSLYGLSGHRAFIINSGILIDIFIDEPPEYVLINNYKCETISSMIKLRENTLKYYKHKLSNINLNKINENLKRLKNTI